MQQRKCFTVMSRKRHLTTESEKRRDFMQRAPEAMLRRNGLADPPLQPERACTDHRFRLALHIKS